MPELAVVVVGTDEERFRRLAANEDRLQLAREIAKHTRENVDIVVLPAGFLAVENSDGVEAKALELAAIFDGVGLIAGIDEIDEVTDGTKRSRRTKRVEENEDVPADDDEDVDDADTRRRGKGGASVAATGASDGYHYWAFAAENGRLTGGPWWQRSAYSGERAASTEAHVATFGGIRVGVLLCGELYNAALADSLAGATPDVVVDLGHRSMTRILRSLERVASTTRRTVLHVQHVALGSQGASKWRASVAGLENDRGYRWASYDAAGWKSGDLWAEVKVWDL